MHPPHPQHKKTPNTLLISGSASLFYYHIILCKLTNPACLIESIDICIRRNSYPAKNNFRVGHSVAYLWSSYARPVPAVMHLVTRWTISHNCFIKQAIHTQFPKTAVCCIHTEQGHLHECNFEINWSWLSIAMTILLIQRCLEEFFSEFFFLLETHTILQLCDHNCKVSIGELQSPLGSSRRTWGAPVSRRTWVSANPQESSPSMVHTW